MQGARVVVGPNGAPVKRPAEGRKAVAAVTVDLSAASSVGRCVPRGRVCRSPHVEDSSPTTTTATTGEQLAAELLPELTIEGCLSLSMSPRRRALTRAWGSSCSRWHGGCRKK